MNPTAPPFELPKTPVDYVEPIEAAVRGGADVADYMTAAMAKEPANIFLIGCGGSLFTFDPLHNILDHSPVPVFRFNADELLLRRPAQFGPDSLVIISSSNGATKETARAAAVARELGATVVGVTQDPNSVVAVECEKLFLHRGVEAKQIVLAQIGWSILRAQGVAPEYDAILSAVGASPRLFLESIEETDEQLATIAADLFDEPMVYVLGTGPLLGAAQTFAMCYLQEMQWMNAAAISAGEFLHGPFEVVTPDVPVLLFLGEDATRPMGNRAQKFLAAHTERLHVIDAASLALSGIPASERSVVSTMVVGSALLNRLAEHFQSRSGHSMKDRRYMWKIDY
ncbi:MAG TPA: SIS domain-containing protein [Acidimicrobiales bacterium]|nr:SIS domain-containing protein [Acidimicrobiales bacterium]